MNLGVSVLVHLEKRHFKKFVSSFILRNLRKLLITNHITPWSTVLIVKKVIGVWVSWSVNFQSFIHCDVSNISPLTSILNMLNSVRSHINYFEVDFNIILPSTLTFTKMALPLQIFELKSYRPMYLFSSWVAAQLAASKEGLSSVSK
jgi:hypothetical protein